MNPPDLQITLLDIYRRLSSKYGPQRWWPADGPFEVIVGAILTQSAAWKNVEKCILNLKVAGVLSPSGLRNLSSKELSGLIHSSGYYNAKAVKIKAFVTWFGDKYGDNLDKLFEEDLSRFREELLSIHGIGEETADSILLYAGNKPVFVIDAYTRRVVDRLRIPVKGNKYNHYQKLFTDNLPQDVHMFNEFHALFVALCKDNCLKTPQCRKCCLAEICNNSQSVRRTSSPLLHQHP
jgi:endonuclease III related protein